MRNAKHNLGNAQKAFIDALAKYQAATLKKNLAIKRLSGHARDYCCALHAVVEKTGVLVVAQR